jgi:hypothetical protein
MRVASILLVCVMLLGVSSALAAHRLKTKLAAASLQPIRSTVGFQCTLLGVTQDCHEWCNTNCGGPCSNCETENAGPCECDDIPAINDKYALMVKLGYSCRYEGATQDCATWCTDTCSGPCSVCLNGDGASCACDDLPAITNGAEEDKYAKMIKLGYSCRYMGATQDCSTWCTDTCSAPCSVCLESDGSDCACDEVPAITNGAEADKYALMVKLGYTCRYEGVTQDCATWCTDTCSAPCSVCLESSGSACACDELPAISNGLESSAIRSSPDVHGNKDAKVGFSCRFEGVTQDCAAWCTSTCSGPCSVCLNGDGADCACDEIPAINDKQ